MATILLSKTNINDIAKELNISSLTYESLCLTKTQKWCNEMLFALENIALPEESSIVNYSRLFGKDYKLYQLAKSYFNSKEYARAVYYLNKSESPICYFLSAFSKYMSMSKKFVDNKSDLFSNSDTSNLESLQSLRHELKSKYQKSQLDGYTLYIYGTILSKLKLNEEAIQILIEAVNKQPTLWCAWLELANLIRTIDLLNSINQTSLPQHWIKDLFLAHCYMELSLSEEALNIYLEYSNKGFEKSIYLKSQIAKCYDILREGQECKLTFESIRKLDPYNLDYMDIYSNILFVLEEHAQLAILAQEACEIDKYRPESCCIIGNYYSLQNDHHKAVTYFQRALKLNPSYLQAWTLMGHEFMELKNSSAAIQSYTHAINLNPKDYRAWYGLGQTYEILKLYSYSLYYYKQVYLMRPNDSRFIVALADVYVKLEKWDEARRCYIKAYSVGDCEGTALCKLAKIYEKLNDPVNAAIAYDKYTQDQKLMQGSSNICGNDLSQAYAFLANYYFKKGRLDNAYEAATKCLEFPETRSEAQSLLNQIAQTRSLKEQENNPLNNDIETINNNNDVTINTKTNVDLDINLNDSSSIALMKQKLFNKSTIVQSSSITGGIETTANINTTIPTSTVTDSDSEAEGAFNDFQIKRFQLRKDI